MTLQFQVGKEYATRSTADYDTIFSFVILARTPKSVTVNVHGKLVRRGLFLFDGVEQFKPYGTYSMCPIVSAERPRE